MKDKRFSLKFRILNFLSCDLLRNYLAVGVYSYINNSIDILNENRYSDAYKIELLEEKIIKAKQGMDDIWKI